MSSLSPCAGCGGTSDDDQPTFLLSCSHVVHCGLRPPRVVPYRTNTKSMFIFGVRFACVATSSSNNSLECCECGKMLTWNECARVLDDRDSYLALGLDMLKAPDVVEPQVMTCTDRLVAVLKGDLTTRATTTTTPSPSLKTPPPPPQPAKTLTGYDQIRSLFEFYESNPDIEQFGDVLTVAIADGESSGKIKERQAQEFWDRLEILSQQRTAKKNGNTSTAPTITPSKLPSGTGYGGNESDASTLKKQVEASETKRKRERQERDGLLQSAADELSRALAGLPATSAVFVAIEVLLRRDGGALYHLRAELQNDIEDILHREPVFKSVLDLCFVLASNPALVPLLLSSRHIKTAPPKCSQSFLLEWAKNPREKIPDAMIAPQFAEEGSTIFDTLKTLQSSLAKLKGTATEERLFNNVCRCLDAAMASLPLHPHFANMDPEALMRKKMINALVAVTNAAPDMRLSDSIALKSTLKSIYCEMLERYKFVTMDILNLMGSGGGGNGGKVNYAYESAVTASTGRPPVRERMRRIAVELSGLQNSLQVHWSSSVFFAIDEQRPDVISFLVVGPEGTPYQNGLFLFDLFLPLDWPQQPPQCTFKTTGGGKVRMNPNLYANGKVCLSLLGTWSGPPWDPKTSTLLQLIISIQSLILVPYPYTNEPGLEATPLNDHRVVDYNTNIRFATLRLAMLDMCRAPPKLFEEIVKLHFVLKMDEIIETLGAWEAGFVKPPSVDEGKNVTVTAAISQFANAKKELVTEMNKLRDDMIHGEAGVSSRAGTSDSGGGKVGL